MQGKFSFWFHLGFSFIWVSFLVLFCGVYELQHGNIHKTQAFGHYLLFDPMKISLTKRSWKLKLLGHVWKPDQVKWCHFTTNRHIHAADKGSLNFTVRSGHQPFWTVTFNRIKRSKWMDYSKFPEGTTKKSSCSSQILFVFRVKGLCIEPVWFCQEEQELSILFQHLW